MWVQRGVSLHRLRNNQRLSRIIRHNALTGWTVARCHITDAEAVAPTLIIREFMESGRSIARHSHEFRCERGQHQCPLEPPSVLVRGGTRGHRGTGRTVVAVRTTRSLRIIGGRL